MLNPKIKVATYVRDTSVLGAQKFNDFELTIVNAWKAEADAILVASPQVLGDTYEELVTNLNRLAAVNLALVISPPASERQNQN